MTWKLTTTPGIVDYVSELELASGEYPILKLEGGVLQVAVHPDDMEKLLYSLGPIPEEGADLVFAMGSVGTHGLEGVKSIESMPGLDVYMLGYVGDRRNFMEAIAIP